MNKEKIIMRYRVFLLLVVFLGISFFLTKGVVANDFDESKGTVLFDFDNDPSTFESWWDSDVLVIPLQNVSFWAIVEDIDNTSTELTITLYTSNDSFNLDNNSYSMVFLQEVSPNNYKFNYTFTGQPDGTYLHYYYQVYDGETYVEEDNSGLFYDIQWQVVAIVLPPGGPARPRTTTVDEEKRAMIVRDMNMQVVIITLVLGSLIVLGVKQYIKYREEHSY